MRRGHANLLCIVPSLSDDLRGESESSQRPCKRTQVTIPCIPVRRRRAGAWGSVEQAQAVSSSGALRLLLPSPGLPRLQWHRSPSRSLGVARLGGRLYTGTRLVAGVASSCQRAVGTQQKNLVTLLDLCVSSLRRGHANLLCVVPTLTDDPRRESHFVGCFF